MCVCVLYRGVSHSALSTMQVIEQVAPEHSGSNKSGYDRYSGRGRNRDNDMDDDFEMIGNFSSGPPK